MTALFAYPKNAAFGRMVSKEAIYRHSTLSGRVTELFVRQLERITSSYKLAPVTINLPATPTLPQIQVFSIQLRQEGCAPEILDAIDGAVQFPLLFELCYQNRVRGAAAWKRLAEPPVAGAATGKWIISSHFSGPWLAQDAPRTALPHALNLEALYAALLEPLLPLAARPGEALAERIARIETAKKLQLEIERCEKKLHNEKQYNKKITINQELRAVQARLSSLQ